jgi:hypothetical protein
MVNDMENVQERAAVAVSDFLAIVLIGAGSSYARGPNREDVLDRVGRIIVDDWGSIYDVGGKPCEVNLYDVPAGIDKVWWDARGVWAEGRDEPLERLELVEIVLPKARKRRR